MSCESKQLVIVLARILKLRGPTRNRSLEQKCSRLFSDLVRGGWVFESFGLWDQAGLTAYMEVLAQIFFATLFPKSEVWAPYRERPLGCKLSLERNCQASAQMCENARQLRSGAAVLLRSCMWVRTSDS